MKQRSGAAHLEAVRHPRRSYHVDWSMKSRLFTILMLLLTFIQSCHVSNQHDEDETVPAFPMETQTQMALATPTPTRFLPPMLNDSYPLVQWSDHLSEDLSRRMENYPDTLDHLGRGYHDYGYFQAYYPSVIALSESVLRFPQSEFIEEWNWRLAYTMALAFQAPADEDTQAADFYLSLLEEALNKGMTSILELPSWFHDREPRLNLFLLELDQIPSQTYLYLGEVTDFPESKGPGSGFFFVVTKYSGGYKLFLLSSDFVFNEESWIDYQMEDVTGDGVSEILLVHTRGSNFVGTINWLHVFDLTGIPPEELIFDVAGRCGCCFGTPSWSEGNLLVTLQEGGSSEIVIRDQHDLACTIDSINHYAWNGDWFELRQTEYQIVDDGEKYLDYCEVSGHIDMFLRMGSPNDQIGLLEMILPYAPLSSMTWSEEGPIDTPIDHVDSLRFRLGVYYTLEGRNEDAIHILSEILSNPVVEESSWIQYAREFLHNYETADHIYPACVTAPFCDIRVAIEKLIRGIPSENLESAIDILRQTHVPISSSGEVDIDRVGDFEQWFTANRHDGKGYDLWLLMNYSEGVKGAYLGQVDNPYPILTVLETPEGATEIVINNLDRYSFHRVDLSGEPFAFAIQEDAYSPEYLVDTELDKTIEDLFSGVDPLVVEGKLRSIAEMDGFEESDRYLYILGVTYELMGEKEQARDTYFSIWEKFPESPFSIMAREKIGGN